MGSRSRSRVIPYDVRGPFHYTRNSTSTNTDVPFSVNIVGIQNTTDEEHRWRGSAKGGNVGGPFYSSKQEYHGLLPMVNMDFTVFGTRIRYKGPMAIYNTGSVYPTATGSSPSDLIGLGTTAIARCAPTSPVASAAQFIGELREGLPSAIGSSLTRGRARDLSKNSGGEYLNYQFGVKPIINDVQKFATAVKDGHKILAQYERDSGRLVRRRYYFPTTITTTVENRPPAYPVPVFVTQAYRGGPFPVTLTTETTVERWFSGAFTYYLNMGTSARDRMERHVQEANKLLGVRLTPELVWNLAPWTWAADWFANVGDVAHNVSAFQSDGLVLHHGYMMETSTVRRTYEMRDVGLVSCPTVNISQTFTSVVKQRVQATPYGFGFNMAGLSLRQAAIVAALGLSRGR